MTTKNMTSATKKILVPQFKEKIALRNTAIWLALFFAVYAIIGTLIRLYPPEFDKQILLWANPDEPILGLDEFFIIITNFSIPLTATVGIWSFIAFNVITAKPEKKEMIIIDSFSRRNYLFTAFNILDYKCMELRARSQPCYLHYSACCIPNVHLCQLFNPKPEYRRSS